MLQIRTNTCCFTRSVRVGFEISRAIFSTLFYDTRHCLAPSSRTLTPSHQDTHSIFDRDGHHQDTCLVSVKSHCVMEFDSVPQACSFES